MNRLILYRAQGAEVCPEVGADLRTRLFGVWRNREEIGQLLGEVR